MRRVLVAMAITGLLVTPPAVVGSSRRAWANGSQPVVAVIGDSLLRAASSEPPSFRVNARAGRMLSTAPIPITQMVERRDPDVVVVALGTNDVARNRPLSDMAQSLEAAIEAADGRCVVLVTVSPLGTPFYNPQWRRAATRFNRLVLGTGRPVARWSRAVQQDASLLLPDGVHLTESGLAAYTGLLRSTAATCP